jgi:hypothetical protein
LYSVRIAHSFRASRYEVSVNDLAALRYHAWKDVGGGRVESETFFDASDEVREMLTCLFRTESEWRGGLRYLLFGFLQVRAREQAGA